MELEIEGVTDQGVSQAGNSSDSAMNGVAFVTAIAWPKEGELSPCMAVD